MKHIVPFTLPVNTQEAEVLMTSQGQTILTIPVIAKGREIVSVDFGDLPSGLYSCHLMVNNSRIASRDLLVH